MTEKVFKNLEKYRNRAVRVLVACEGSEDISMKGTLRHISPYRFIVLEHAGSYYILPFVGNMQGIKEIRGIRGKLFYENKCLDYSITGHLHEAEQLTYANCLREKSFKTDKFNLTISDDDYYTAEVEVLRKDLFAEGRMIAKKFHHSMTAQH